MKLTDFEEVKKLVEMKNGVENIDRSMIHFVISNPEYGGTRTTLDLSGFAEDVATFKHNLGVSIESKLRELGVETEDREDEKPPHPREYCKNWKQTVLSDGRTSIEPVTATEVKEMEKEQIERMKAEWKGGNPADIPDEVELDGVVWKKVKADPPSKNPSQGFSSDGNGGIIDTGHLVDQVVQ